ncbi:MAG: hypothetical protein Q8Q09_26945 [Deltaproteobacteria bacterium]|nr:hypothetical protein [Deltaproteobacteria bacterium]
MASETRQPAPPPRSLTPLGRGRVRDPYADLLRDTRGLRREQAAARDAWFAGLRWDRKEETLFELEMLLKGLVCFANPRNHPGGAKRSPTVALDFKEELTIARMTLFRVVTLCRQLLDTRDRAYVFQRYLETLLPEDPARARMQRDAAVQESPEDALLHLRHSLTLIGELMDGLLRLERVPFRLFHASLAMVQREIARNQFFNPLIALEFRPEFDRIRTVPALDVIQAVDNDAAHRVTALGFLSMFRLLRYSQLVRALVGEPQQLQRVYVLLALLRSDARAIVGYLRGRAGAVLADGYERELLKIPAREIGQRFDQLAIEAHWLASLRGTLEAIASSLRVEIRAVFEVRVPSSQRSPSSADLARGVVSAMDGLDEVVQSAVVRLAQAIRPSLDTGDLFDGLDAKRTVSERLRRDVWMFAQVLRAFVTRARAVPESDDAWGSQSSFQFVREFLGYFRSMGYQLLRASDYPDFDRFLTAIEGLHESDFVDPARMISAINECERFGLFLVETFERISQRAELVGQAFDKRAAAVALRLHLGA